MGVAAGRAWHRVGDDVLAPAARLAGRRLHKVLLDELADADKIDWSRASIDSQVVAAKRGASTPARIRRIAARRARSAMLWSTPTAARSR